MKLKVYVIDVELPPRVKKWLLRAVSATLVLGTAGAALAANPLHVWTTGDVLEAADLNANFSNLEGRIASSWALDNGDLHNANPSGRVGIGTSTPSAALDVNGTFIRKIARVHGNGPNDQTSNGAIPSRLMQYTKSQAATALRITWMDNLRCLGQDKVSCEWEIKVDGRSCADPGPLVYDVYNDAGNAIATNLHRPEAVLGTCMGLSAGPHTIQVYVKAPASNPPGGSDGKAAPGVPWTGWNVAYWSIEVEEVY